MSRLGEVTQLVHPLKHDVEFHVRVVTSSGEIQDLLLTARDMARARGNADANRSLLPKAKLPPHSPLWKRLLRRL